MRNLRTLGSKISIQMPGCVIQSSGELFQSGNYGLPWEQRSLPTLPKESEVGQKCYKNRLSNGICIISQVNTSLNVSTKANMRNLISALCNISSLYVQFTPQKIPRRRCHRSPACLCQVLFYTNFANC